MADLDMSLEHRRELKQQAARSRAVPSAVDEAASAVPGDTTPTDLRLLRIERKLDRMAHLISGLPTSDSLRTMMAVLTALAVVVGLFGGSLTRP